LREQRERSDLSDLREQRERSDLSDLSERSDFSDLSERSDFSDLRELSDGSELSDGNDLNAEIAGWMEYKQRMRCFPENENSYFSERSEISD